MSVKDLFGTNADFEKNGITIDYGDFEIKIARAGGANKRFNRILRVKAQPFQRAIQTQTLDDERSNRLMYEVYAASVILGWTGVTDDEGKTISFTYENCIALFEKYPDLFADIQEQAQNIRLFKEEIREEDGKN